MEETYGILAFAIGGALLLFDINLIIENTNKPWIDTNLFTAYFIVPIGFITFLLLGLGLYLILKAARDKRTQQNTPRIKPLTQG